MLLIPCCTTARSCYSGEGNFCCSVVFQKLLSTGVPQQVNYARSSTRCQLHSIELTLPVAAFINSSRLINSVSSTCVNSDETTSQMNQLRCAMHMESRASSFNGSKRPLDRNTVTKAVGVASQLSPTEGTRWLHWSGTGLYMSRQVARQGSDLICVSNCIHSVQSYKHRTCLYAQFAV
jgi:hypothetical protein